MFTPQWGQLGFQSVSLSLPPHFGQVAAIIIPPKPEERLREILKQIFLRRKIGVRVGERIFYIKHLGVIYLFFTNLYNR